jgi:ATP-dependent RNA helicase DHX33
VVKKGRDAIVDKVEANDTVVVLGETGSGKSTRAFYPHLAGHRYLFSDAEIPQFLLESSVPRPNPRIAVTQPRRVAATSLAARVAEEVGCNLRETVGYTVRFDDCSSESTRLKYMTDGSLLQELLGDPLLTAYDIIIIDEAHERSLRTDMLLGFLKQLQTRRKELASNGEKDSNGVPVSPLKLIIMSATLDAQRFSDFFGGAEILYVKGRQHKVTVHYCCEPQTDYLEAALKTFFQIHVERPPGDVLIFLTGQDEIENLQATIKQYAADLKPEQLKVPNQPTLFGDRFKLIHSC